MGERNEADFLQLDALSGANLQMLLAGFCPFLRTVTPE